MCFLAVQQAPVCTHRTDQPFLQRRPAGVGGHPSDLRQIPRKEGRPEGTLWKRAPEFLFPHQILGEFHKKPLSTVDVFFDCCKKCPETTVINAQGHLFRPYFFFIVRAFISTLLILF